MKGRALGSAIVVMAVLSAALWLLGQTAPAAYLFLLGTAVVGVVAAARRDLDSLVAAALALGVGFSVLHAGIPFGYRVPPALIISFVLFWQTRKFRHIPRMPLWWAFFVGLLLLGMVNLLRIYSSSEVSYAVSQVLWLGAEVGVAWLALDWSQTRTRGPGPGVFWATGLMGSALLLVPVRLSLSERIGLDQGMDPNGVALLGDQVILAFVCLYLLWPSRKTAIALGLGATYGTFILIDTVSRQGIIIAVVILAAAIGLSDRFGKKIKALIIVSAAVALALTTISGEKKEYVEQRFDRATQQGERVSRIAHLRVAAAIALSKPLGLGAGGFRYEYWERARAAGLSTGNPFPRPHGLLAMALADWGLPGGALYLLTMGFLAVDVFSSAGALGTARKTAFLVAVLGSLAGTGIPMLALAMAAYPGPSPQVGHTRQNTAVGPPGSRHALRWGWMERQLRPSGRPAPPYQGVRRP